MQVAVNGFNNITEKGGILVAAIAGVFVLFAVIKLLNNGRWEEFRSDMTKIAIGTCVALGALPIITMFSGLF